MKTSKMIVKDCQRCGREFKNYECQNRRYCSRECVKDPKRTEFKCEYCTLEFSILSSVVRAREKHSPIRYCSKKCDGASRKKQTERDCKNCQMPFMSSRKYPFGQFCGRFCVDQFAKKTGSRKRNGFWYENGYKVLYLEGDGSVKEHIKIMEQSIGQKIKTGDVVHHRNFIKDDNRLENLQILSRGQHSKLHREYEKKNGKKFFLKKKTVEASFPITIEER